MTIRDIKEKGLLLLECISGSRAYGLDTPQSDTDIKGVFYLPESDFYGLEYIDQINNDTNDEVYYELKKFVAMLLKNNPNLLELLATPDDCILYRHPVMNQLPLELFLSALCKETFGNYAVTQIKKARGLNKKLLNPVDKERKTVIDFCFVIKGRQSTPLSEWLRLNSLCQEHCGLAGILHAKGMYTLFYDNENLYKYRGVVSSTEANEVCLSSIPKGEKELAYLFFNKDGYSVYCKEYNEYWSWVEKRNEVRYQGNQAHGGDYDSKNMMHTIRLLQVAEEIGRTGRLQVRRPNREQLLQIKAGAFSYEELLQMAEVLQHKMTESYHVSTLPEAPDTTAVEKILVTMRQQLYGKHT